MVASEAGEGHDLVSHHEGVATGAALRLGLPLRRRQLRLHLHATRAVNEGAGAGYRHACRLRGSN